MNLQEAAAFLKITLPTTMNALKRQYRRRSLEEHPDQSKHPRARERFQFLKDAFELLKGSASIESDGDNTSIFTTDGRSLSELGLGIGPTTNGKPCDSCSGKGFNTTHHRDSCPDCSLSWDGTYEYKCRRCGGDGNYKRGSRVIGECFQCAGTGWSVPRDSIYRYRNGCIKCNGSGHLASERVARYYTCSYCKGTGEIMIMNPVIPKGLLNV